MSLDYRKMPVQGAGTSKQKTIPKSGHPGPVSVQEAGEPQEEHDADIQFPLYAGLNLVSRGIQAGGIPEESDVGESGVPDEIRVRNVDFFLDRLGRVIHMTCNKDIQKPMPVEAIRALYRGIYKNLAKEEKRGISPMLEKLIVTALSRVPSYLLAEKDPDHPGENEIPDIKELLALDAYLQEYEQINPEGESSATFSGYHRGAAGQPDFVYKNKKEKTLKSYDPLRLPRKGGEEIWLKSAYEHHAGGKNTGAVCILDVSDATETQLDNWISIFRDKLIQIRSFLENQGDENQIKDELMHLCNTYVVSYGQNAENVKVKELKTIFDETREFLRKHPELMQLEKWRENEMSGPFSEDMFGGLFDIP